MYDKDEIKQNITIEQMIDIVEALGASTPIIRSEILMIENICHNLPGESRGHKLYYYDNTKLFRCYTDCGEYFDVFELVIKTRKIQENEDWEMFKAIIWVADFLGIAPKLKEFDDLDSDAFQFLKEIKALENKISKFSQKREQELKIFDDTILNNMSLIPAGSWLREGITIDTMKKYGIKYYLSEDKIVIPHRDINGNLIGIRGRTMIKEESEMFGKYMPLKIGDTMYNHPLSFALYGLYENQDNIRKAKKVFIFEGEKSVLLYDSYFGSSSNIAVACCGSSISSFQIDLLYNLGVEEAIIAFDKEFEELNSKEHKRNIKALMKLKDKFMNRMKVSFLYDSKNNMLELKDSPIDKGKDTFLTLFKNRVII